MTTSESVDKLAAALSIAQGQFDAIHRTREVVVRPKDQAKSSYKFLYAPLDEILRATRKALTDNGLAISHPCDTNETHLRCGTRLLHASGQWLEDVLEFPRPGGLQEIGSALTYMRRYTLTGILGVVADEDDDGNGAEGNDFEAKDREPSPACPKCGTNANVIKGKEEYGGGWLCWNKPDKNKNGCGHKWQDGEGVTTEAAPKKTTARKTTKASDKPADDGPRNVPIDDGKEDLRKATSAYSSAMARLTNFHGTDEQFSEFKGKFFDWQTKAVADRAITEDQAKALTTALGKVEDGRQANKAAA